MDPEKIVYQSSPAQVVNLNYYLLSFLVAAAIVTASVLAGSPEILLALLLPIGYAFYKWLVVRSVKLTLTDQRLIITQGIFTKRTNETELYRVRDTSITEPFFYRMFGVGNIIIYSTDEAEGQLHFQAYSKPHWLKDQIRNNAETSRKARRWGADSVLIQDNNNPI